eukprot:GGOE01014242.1.p1 GENE.GGOE01014242.1~~GGOE01014242.1.p1  ORF type:complete len:570 (-),score=155.24 GGOE01014242.1:185-1894(-)
MLENMEDPDCLAAFTGLDPVFCLALHEKTVIYGSHSGMLKTFSAENGAVEANFKGHTGIVKQLCVVADDDDNNAGARLYSAGADGVVRAWDLALCACMAKSEPVGGAIETLEHSPGKGDSQARLLVGCADGTIHFLAVGTLRHIHTLRLHTGRVGGLCQVDDILYSCSTDGLAKAVDLQKSQLVAVFEGTVAVRCMQFCPAADDADPPLLALGCSDSVIRLYDSRSSTCVRQLLGHTELVTRLLVADKLLFSASEDGTVRQWSVEEGVCEYTFRGHSAAVTGLCLSNRGELFSSSIDKSVRLWDRDGAQERLRVQRLLDPTGYTPKFAFAAKTGAALISRSALTSASSTKRPAPKSASSRASRPNSSASRPTSGASRPSSGASSPKSRAKERLEAELFEFRIGHLGSIHTTFLKHTEENGTLLFPEFQRCLSVLGVSQLPLVEKVFSVYMTQTGSTRRFPYRPFIQEVHELVDGPSQERLYRLCWNLYDVRRKGALLRSEVERWVDNPLVTRAGRSPTQVAEMLELFVNSEIGEPELTFTDFVDAMNGSPRLVQSFLPMILLTLDRVLQ